MEYLREFNLVSVVLRLVLASICGGVMGLDREKRGRAAGIRTYYIVCLGASCAVLLGQYLNFMLNGSWAYCITEIGAKTDVARIAERTISGIGFLGAGSILLTKNNQVQGLTSAASIMACAVLGLAIGIGFYELAIVGFVFILLSLVLFAAVDFKTREKICETRFLIKMTDATKLARVLDAVNDFGAKIIGYDYIDNDETGIDLRVIIPSFSKASDFITTVFALGCIESVKKI